MHQLDQPTGSEQQGQRDLRTEHGGGEIGGVDLGRHARPERDLAKGPLVLGHGDLVLGPAVDVVEHGPREDSLGETSRVGDVVDLAGRGHVVRQP
jgi:hypothetical protein